MEIGNAIAVAGVWVCCGMVWHSKTVTGAGAIIVTIIAVIITVWLK